MKIKRIIKKNSFWAGLWLAQLVLFYLLPKFDFGIKLAELYFREAQIFRIPRVNLYTISVGDVFYSALTLILLVLTLFLLRKKWRKKSMTVLLIILNAINLVYQPLWGMLYNKTPLLPAEQIGHPLNILRLESLAQKHLWEANFYRQQLDDNLTQHRSLMLQGISASLNKAVYSTDSLRVSPFPQQIALKASLFSGAMSSTGISGYYNPFSGEAQYNSDLPFTMLPFTMAHESAHQIGYAREEEANFIGFLLALNSDNKYLNFGAHWFAFKNILHNIAKVDPEIAQGIMEGVPLSLAQEYQNEKLFFKKHRGPLNSVFSFTNDVFLKSNRQEGSISYNYFIYLLDEYELQEEEKGTAR